MEAGADGYIVKSGFDQTALLSAVEHLLGTPG
jgi:DNA-binding NarL/FixJ family response regulator